MLILIAPILVLIGTVIYGQVLVYNTENESGIEKFDCIYYLFTVGEEVPYCRRPGGNEVVNRHGDGCENGGEKKLFRDLLDNNTSPNHVLQWSSDVEAVDIYASLFYNRSLVDEDDDRFLCNCSKPGTFGKYCEYQLTHEAKTFSEAINAQFQQKRDGDSWDTQRYGKILCYQTLPCYSGPLCLDWREICDGIQRCWHGIDEENWDKLEFNECEDDEFRCTNGMCIAEEFWLDGDFDCMDWSDEYLTSFGQLCPLEPNSFECDEHICLKQHYSCGDGQCVDWYIRMAFQRFGKADDDCFNKRNLNYMCEIGHHRSAWTLEDGRCWPDKGYDDARYPPWDMIDASNLTKEDKCLYLFRCIWSEDFEQHCPCNRWNCTQLLVTVCSNRDHLIQYPPEGLINPNILIFYDYTQSIKNLNFHYFRLTGSLRCRGYFFETRLHYGMIILSALIYDRLIYRELCNDDSSAAGYKNFSSHFQMDKYCWNQSRTFNNRPYAVHPDICRRTLECISQYRIHDGLSDCFLDYDEASTLKRSYCTGNVGRHRFQCYNNEHRCLPLNMLGSSVPQCSNRYDNSWYGNGVVGSFRQENPCIQGNTAACNRVKVYIQQSSMKNYSNNHSSVASQIQRPESQKYMPFRSYCNTLWDLDDYSDEISFSCQPWVCYHNEYQCQTRQCIPVAWVCDGEWDCADASDEEATVLIKEWSIHNARLPDLATRIAKCSQLYAATPFSNICNQSFEYGCYRSGVETPLNIKKYRPCINLTQIGDGVEDCYNAYDEKNTFEANSDIKAMWGFHYRCENGRHEIYTQACSAMQICPNILCSDARDKNQSCFHAKDFICPDEDQCRPNIRCNGVLECPNGEDEYWCLSGPLINQNQYRFTKAEILMRRQDPISPIWYPADAMHLLIQQQVPQSISDRRRAEFFKAHSYRCNRGVAVLHMNETQCLCPPAYYGRWCEFYSDRISVIVHLDQKSFPDALTNITLKIKATFLLEDEMIDHHEFHIVPSVEREKLMKHRFYLVYSRARRMLAYKQWRYINRTDVITNHPYSVHFDLFALWKNNTVEELGSWHYPVYFDYLPAFRLAIVLRFPFWFGNVTHNLSHSNNCNENSTYLPIFNQNRSYHCACRSGYYGANCSIYEHRCDTYCAVNAFCRPYSYVLQTKENKPHCICPLDHFGLHCNLRHHNCSSNPCLNGGACSSNYDYNGEEPFRCKCPWGFDGKRCQKQKISVRVVLNMTERSVVRAVVVQLYDYNPTGFVLRIRYQQVHQSMPSTISYYSSSDYAPMLGIMKVYEDDLSNPQYFVTYFLYLPLVNITSSPQRCPQAVSLLSKGLEIHQNVPDVFRYHEICQTNIEQLCFYDKTYLCLCQKNHSRADCFIHDTQLDHCEHCLSGGKCLQGDSKDSNDFICLCPSCHQGRLCEFNLQAFGFTLDSLLIGYSTKIKIVYTSIALLLFSIGLVTNLCSLVTFIRPTPRKFGPGNYLFLVTCFSQAALFCLLLKFIQITFVIVNMQSCKAIIYLLSVFTRSVYWLTSWVTVDRLLIIIFPTSSILKNPRLAVALCIATSIIVFGAHVHEVIYYIKIQHIPTGLPVCVTNFNTPLVSNFNQISTLIHYLCPFFIQVVCITLLIVLIAFSRKKTIEAKSTFTQVLKKQFHTQKELYITPIIIILSALPQTILTFILACAQLSDWQRHTLLGAYLLSYAPQVSGFILYVLPSSSYKKEFSQTLLAQKYFKPMLEKKKAGAINAKSNK